MSAATLGARTGPAWIGLVILTFMVGVLAHHVTRGTQQAPGLAVVALVAAAIALPRCRGITLYMSVALFAAGITLAAIGHLWAEWLAGTVALGSVLAVVTFAQLFAEPIELGAYHRNIVRGLAACIRRPSARAQVAVLASFLLSCLAAGGALAATYRVLIRPDDDEAVRNAIMRSAMRGSGAAIGLTPITGVFGATMAVTGLSAPSLFLFALPAAVVAVGLGLVFSFQARLAPVIEEPEPPDWTRLRHLAVAAGALGCSILALDSLPNVGAIDAIVISLASVAIVWGLVLDHRRFLPRLRSFPSRIVNSAAPSVALFVSGGALASVLAGSGWMNGPLSSVLSLPSVTLTTMAIGVVVWLLFHLGIHPAVAVILVAPAALPSGVSPALFAGAVLAAAGVAVISSPFGMISHLAAALSGRSAFEVGVKMHVLFGLVSLFVSLALVSIVLT